MAHLASITVHGTSMTGAVTEVGGELVWAPSGAPARSRSDAVTHGGFDDDSPTPTSVLLLRVLNRTSSDRTTTYRPLTLLARPDPPGADPAATAAPEHLETVDVEPADTVPVSHTAPPRGTIAAAPVPRSEGESPEVRVAPRSSSTVMDVLMGQAWRPVRR